MMGIEAIGSAGWIGLLLPLVLSSKLTDRVAWILSPPATRMLTLCEIQDLTDDGRAAGAGRERFQMIQQNIAMRVFESAHCWSISSWNGLPTIAIPDFSHARLLVAGVLVTPVGALVCTLR